MTSTLSNLQFMTAGGPIDIISFDKLVTTIQRFEPEGRQLIVPMYDNSARMIARDSGPNPSEMSITAREFEFKTLEKIISYKDIRKMEYMYNVNIDSHFTATDLLALTEISNQIRERLMYYVSKRKTEFYIKNLTTEAIHDLARKYIRNSGHLRKWLAAHIDLSPSQRFFAILEENTFKAYYSKPQLIRRHDTADMVMRLHGELIEMNPNSWITGRYDNIQYLDELSALRMVER